jgi:hypothetical protein
MLKGLADAMDRVCEADPTQLADRDGIVELYRQRARLDAVIANVTAAFDAQQGYADDGAKTTAAWVATVTRAPMKQAKREVRVGRALRQMPLVEAAFVSGAIGLDHVVLLASAQRLSPKAFERDEELLVSHATAMRFSHFAKALRYWRQQAAPDDVEDEAADQRAARALHLDRSYEGMWFGTMTFDPTSGTIVNDELERLERQLFDEDWAEARERLGDGATHLDLRRSAAQRRADAMVEMAIRSRTAPANGRRPEPLFTVVVGYETFAGRICEMADGTVVTPGTLASWLDRAWIERVVFDGPSRVMDVSVRRRLFEGATRRAIEVRDRECFHPYCEEPASRCQVDHIEPYGAGGETVEQNGRCACPFHNRERHRRRGEPPPG